MRASLNKTKKNPFSKYSISLTFLASLFDQSSASTSSLLQFFYVLHPACVADSLIGHNRISSESRTHSVSCSGTFGRGKKMNCLAVTYIICI